MTHKPPNSVRKLRNAIGTTAEERDTTFARIQYVVVSTVVAQLLPAGAVKGGCSFSLRRGLSSRQSNDIDAALGGGLTVDQYIDELQRSLSAGWHGFRGGVAAFPPASQEGVPDEYIMRPFVISLDYYGKRLSSIPFELGADELGETKNSSRVIANDCREIFNRIGLPEPDDAPILGAPMQFAQKMHACSADDKIDILNGAAVITPNARAHDLVDIQILAHEYELKDGSVNETCKRLFDSRKQHAWPPTITRREGWADLYERALAQVIPSDEMQLCAGVDTAIETVNQLITDVSSQPIAD